ncbi:MAG: aminoacetone oxidase family FAD-binding enzyme [Planctomycetota bacterium]
MPQTDHDIAIVGAGAAGLFSSIFAGREVSDGQTVIAFDGAKKLGAKILIAGGGRCNVTHDVVRPVDYASGPSSSRNAVKKILKSFTVAQTIEFFREHGVELKVEDTGKLFPTTDRARTVFNALLEACYDANAKLLTEHRVTGIKRLDDGRGFRLTTSQGDFTAKRVVLSTGGLALPKTGSDGFGYRLAQSLGHTVTPTWPALVPLLLPPKHWLTELKGIAVDVELSLAGPTGKVVHRQDGAMLLTHFGLSGPAAMDISRYFGGDFGDQHHALTANLLQPHTFDSLEADLLNQSQTHPRRTVLQVVQPHFPERLAVALVQHGAKLDPALPLAQLPKDARRTLVRTLTALPLPVTADRGYEFAEVTAGGVPLSEVQLSTMESRVCPGLHLAGEILDVDGRIGGYNFQWAWCTGRLAGRGAAKGLIATETKTAQ